MFPCRPELGLVRPEQDIHTRCHQGRHDHQAVPGGAEAVSEIFVFHSTFILVFVVAGIFLSRSTLSGHHGMKPQIRP